MTQTNNAQTNNETRYFDLHMTGVGYLNLQRTRWVTPKKGKKYLCTSISFLRGESSERQKPESTRIDLQIVGQDAYELVLSLMDKYQNGSLTKDSKVFVSAKIGDLYPETYMVDGEARVMLKGRLLLLKSIYVDKVEFFKATENSFS